MEPKTDRPLFEKGFFPGQSSQERIEFLLQFAILAPSTHNSQPWQFRIKESSCVLYGDTRLEIPIADKEKRDFFISLGACLENLVTAARYYKVFDRVEYLLNPKSNEVAEVFFKNIDKPTSVETELKNLVSALVERVNVRGVFEKKEVDTSVVSEKFRKTCNEEGLDIFLTTDAKIIDRLGKLTGEGLKLAYKNPSFRQEMSTWINNSLSRSRQGLPGYSLKIPFLLSFIVPGLIKYFDIGNRLAKLNHLSIKSAPLIVIFSSRTNTPLDFLKIGRVAERLILQLGSQGMRSSIFVAAIEMGTLYETVRRELQLKNRPQFLLCAGFMNTKQQHTPRHAVQSKLVK